jgi:hypothetical protein
MAQKKQIVDVAVILADASPVRTLHRIGRLDVLSLFNLRKTPMLPVDKPARTKKIRSTWIRRSADETGP